MSLGFGIFLSTLAICLLLLYRWTRDRWNWRKGVVRTVVVAVACVVIGGVGTFAYYKYEDRLVRQNGYDEIKLGMTKAEVRYIKGAPSYVLEEPKDRTELKLKWKLVVKTEDIPKEKKLDDYQDWAFNISSNEVDNLTVTFSPKTNNVISIRCYAKKGSCPSVLGLADGDTEETVVTRLGAPTAEQIDVSTKRLDYRHLNLSLWLEKKKVYMLEVKNFDSSD